MIDKIPCELTKGVTATREGLQFASPLMVTVEYFPYDISDLDEPLTIPWKDASERLRYRDGEPYCDVLDDGVGVHCYAADEPQPHDYPRLHRLAAILCDDAEAFLVLHWCVTELGGQG